MAAHEPVMLDMFQYFCKQKRAEVATLVPPGEVQNRLVAMWSQLSRKQKYSYKVDALIEYQNELISQRKQQEQQNAGGNN